MSWLFSVPLPRIPMKTSPSGEAPTDPLLGQVLGGRYVVSRLIGRGGVGLVYLARQRPDNRDVVVKVLAPHWANDGDALRRFDREAKRLSGLHHPNVVEMLDYGHDGDRAYLVMEYLQGELLSELVARKQRLSLEEFVPIAAQILKGIGHAHSREMMVRDVKPANVMLCERKGRANFVKILDFGLAKLLRGEQAITEEHVLGTVGYLAPEAIKGEPLDLRVDVYAIGVLFYYMLAGRLPLDGDSNAAVFYKTINEIPRDLAALVREQDEDVELPGGLVDLIHACLEKDRERRPADADRVVERLIDVVPASMFRLPRAVVPVGGVPRVVPPGVGNTGMMELLGSDTTPTLDVDPISVTPMPGSLPPVGAVTLPPTTEPQPVIHRDTEAVGRKTLSLVAISGIAGAILAVVIVAIVLSSFDRSDRADKDGTAAAAVAGSGVIDFDAIETALVAGSLVDAQRRIDASRALVAGDPGASARLARLERRLEVAELHATAAKLEAAGDRTAAASAHRDVLALDPTDEVSRAALSRLGTVDAATGVQPETTASTSSRPSVTVDIDSRPAANLVVDGSPAGTTPYRGKLPVGRHRVRVSARGYHPWEGDVDVRADGMVPLSVKLRGKGPGRANEPDVVDTTPAPTPVTSSKPADPPPPKPAADPPRPAKDPFLPTPKAGKDDDVFLPVGGKAP